MSDRTLLVLGAEPGSLGATVAQVARVAGFSVMTAGMGHSCDAWLDATVPDSVWIMGSKTPGRAQVPTPENVVCTIGINGVGPDQDDWETSEEWRHYVINVLGPLRMLDAWLGMGGRGHFAMISSNSAHIARTGSRAYCGSKAALSMAVRCTARDVAREHDNVQLRHLMPAVYGYEPGWLEGTPMSERIRAQLGSDVKPHRIPSGEGIKPMALAQQIVSNLMLPNHLVHGAMFRMDGGEQ